MPVGPVDRRGGLLGIPVLQVARSLHGAVGIPAIVHRQDRTIPGALHDKIDLGLIPVDARHVDLAMVTPAPGSPRIQGGREDRFKIGIPGIDPSDDLLPDIP
eukprot:12651535-Alexandrium_andersonii.AAC.1